MVVASDSRRAALIAGAVVCVLAVGAGAAALVRGVAGNHESKAGLSYAQVTPAGEPAAGGATAGAPAAEAAPGVPGGAAGALMGLALPTEDPLAPTEPYRENPFKPVTEPGGTTPVGQGYVNGERLVQLPDTGAYVPEADARIWSDIKRRNMDYFEALEAADFGWRFQWGVTQFPRPRTVLQPSMGAEIPLLLPPASYFVPSTGVVGPVGPGGVETGPKPGVGPQPVGAVGPRVQPKTDPARIRRIAGIVHDGTAAAIVELETAGVVTRLLITPGQTVTIGTTGYNVKAITENEVVLVDTVTGNEVRVPLRSRAATED